jgi:hypothetical protein
MANATWIDSEALEPETDEDNETWHVVISPGEVKALTLEQLDDFYRLDIINTSTQVMGPDMDSWTTLGEALGIDEDDDDEEISVVAEDLTSSTPYSQVTTPAAKPTALPPPPWPPSGATAGPRLIAVPEPESSRTPPKLTPYGAVALEPRRAAPPPGPLPRSAFPPAPKLQPVNVPRATQPFGALPSAPAAAFSPYGVVTHRERPYVPPQPQVHSQSYAPAPHVGGSTLPYGGAPARNAHARAVASDWEQPGASLRPAAYDVGAPRDSIRAFASDPDIFIPKRSSGFGVSLMLVALLAGSGITLYRNDLLRDGARRVGQESAYLRLEAALGGPAFGTPRSIEQMESTKTDTASVLGATSLLGNNDYKPVDTTPTMPKADVAPAEATEKRSAPAAEQAPASASKAVAIDALPPETAKHAPEAAPAKAAAASTQRSTPTPKAESATSKPAISAASARATMKAEAPSKTSKVKAAVHLEDSDEPLPGMDAPAPKKAVAKPAPAPTPEPAEAAAPVGGMPSFLDAAIRERMNKKGPSKAGKQSAPATTPAPKKKKSGGSEYDPLNSDL